MSKCPIWGTPATENLANGDRFLINSPRAGGKYEVTGTGFATLGSLSSEEKARLTTWIVNQHRLGVDVPSLDSKSIRTIAAAPALSVTERRDRLLLYVQATAPQIGGEVVFANAPNAERRMSEIQAWTESIDWHEAGFLMRFAHEDGLLFADPGRGKPLRLSFKGLQRLEELEQRQTLSEQAFVAMWFDRQMQGAYQDGFEPAIRNVGYRPLRVDQQEHIDKIDDKIIAEIRRSRFLVADFTCQVINHTDKPIGIARGGVYYEAGFAQGLSIPVIWTCREDAISHVHFDTRQYNHIVWRTPDDLREKLGDRIGAVIGAGPLATT